MNVNKIVFRFVSISFSVLVLLLVFIGLLRAGSYCYEFGYRVFTEEPVEAAPGRDIVVQVSEDMSDMSIGNMLEEKGLIDSGKLFFIQLKLSVYADKLNPGTYTLNTSMTAKEMMVVMSAVAEPETEVGTSEPETVSEPEEESSEESTGEES